MPADCSRDPDWNGLYGYLLSALYPLPSEAVEVSGRCCHPKQSMIQSDEDGLDAMVHGL